MASDTGGLHDSFDERLTAALNSALIDGEEIVAQEEGDQGQGIILTDSRVLVIKVGITATGTSNGSVLGIFPIGKITSVNVRKGPLGQVIQICADRDTAPEPGSPPDNVVVFTGSQRMKKCDAIAARIEAAIGKPLSRSEPAHSPVEETAAAVLPEESPESMVSVAEAAPHVEEAAAVDAQQTLVEETPAQPRKRAGRQAVSLADEMFAEMMQAQGQTTEKDVPAPLSLPSAPSAPPVQAAPPVAKPEPTASKPPTPEDTSDGFAPNPNLPKPVHHSHGRQRLLAVFGVLGALLVVGVAVVAPMRARDQAVPAPEVVNTRATSLKVIRKQMVDVDRYIATCRATVSSADKALAAFDAAARSSNTSALVSAAKTKTVDDAWRKLSATEVPLGLAGAHEQLVSGMFIAKNAFANAAGLAERSTGVTPHDAVARTREARTLINKGLDAATALRADLHSQIEKRSTRSAKPEPK